MKLLALDIFDALRQMDQEAAPVQPPWPTGLRDFAVYKKSDREHTSHLGILLVGFGSMHFPIAAEHISSIGLRAMGWSYFSDQWDDYAWKFRHIRCGFWCREM